MKMSTPSHEKASTQQGKQNPRAQDQAKSWKGQCPIKQTKVKEKLKKKELRKLFPSGALVQKENLVEFAISIKRTISNSYENFNSKESI